MESRLIAQLEAAIASLEAAGDIMRPGHDWWQLSTAEEEVFGIERARFTRMIMTHHCYESLKGIADSTTWDDASIEEARHQYPAWREKPCAEDFQRFAQTFGKLTLREAYAIFRKAEFWTQRLDVLGFSNKT